MAKRELVVLYGVAETWDKKEPYRVVAVMAEVYKTFYKLRFPDDGNERIWALRAFHHDSFLHRRYFRRFTGNEDHLLRRDKAIEFFFKRRQSDIDTLRENLAEARANLRIARKALR